MSILVEKFECIEYRCNFNYNEQVDEFGNFIKCCLKIFNVKNLDIILKVLMKYFQISEICERTCSRFGFLNLCYEGNEICIKFYLDILNKGYSIGEIIHNLSRIIYGVLICLEVLS